MAGLHVVLVCHTELDFDGSWALYDRLQPRMEESLDRVAQATGRRPKVTHCLTGDFLFERLEEAFRLLEAGHEIGIHSHLPGAQRRPQHSYAGHYAYRLDRQGILHQDRMAGALREVAIAAGLPAPQTHVSGMFTFQSTTIAVLERAGFCVDCSLLPGVDKNRHPACGDFVLADNVRRPDPYAYRPDRDDPWTEGNASMIELPVSANLGGGDVAEQIASLRRRLEEGRAVDVFQSFWHHFEFADLGWTRGSFADAESFLAHCGREPLVQFSTAAEARAALERHGL